MNIHINKEEFESLISPSNVIEKFTIGSRLYNLDDEESDEDYLIITLPYYNLQYNFFQSHHQFQYKDLENNIDYNFCDIITFIKNLCSGDSTVNYELLHSQEFKKSIIGWISTLYINEFRTYTIIKAYTGFADRDLRHLNKRTGHRDLTSGMLHVERGFQFAKDILNKEFNFEFSQSFKELRKRNDWQTNYIKNISLKREEIKEFRQNVLNKELENGTIPRFLKPDIQRQINERLLTMFEYTNLKSINLIPSLLDKIYYCNENIEMKY